VNGDGAAPDQTDETSAGAKFSQIVRPAKRPAPSPDEINHEQKKYNLVVNFCTVTARRSDLDPIELECFESTVTRGKLVLGCESVDESENMSSSFEK
jgi:F420-dependent methylenetetrahydromethanopterin dehydrogenase